MNESVKIRYQEADTFALLIIEGGLSGTIDNGVGTMIDDNSDAVDVNRSSDLRLIEKVPRKRHKQIGRAHV